MNEHPIDGLLNTAMKSLKEMIDVDTIIGKPIETKEGTVIVPISKVCFGFAAGGSEFNTSTLEQTKKKGLEEETNLKLPFGGGSAAGVNIAPMGFLVISETGTKILPVHHANTIDKLLDYIPDFVEKISDVACKDKSYTYEFYEETGTENEDESSPENSQDDCIE